MYGCETDYFEIAGHQAFVVKPSTSAADGSRPWLWYAPTFLPSWHPNERHAWIFSRLLDRGLHVTGVDVGESYGNAEGRRLFQEHYRAMTSRFDLAPKACLLPQSRGGLMHYNWAAEHPDQVQCIGGIYAVCDLSSWPGLDVAAPAYGLSPTELGERLAENNPIDRLAPLAAKRVPIFHLHGDVDTLVPLERNSAELVRRYRALGGPGEVEIIQGKGHQEIDEYFESQRLVDFFLRHATG
jgi:hypothetical protein